MVIAKGRSAFRLTKILETAILVLQLEVEISPLCAFATDATGQLNIFGHNGDTNLDEKGNYVHVSLNFVSAL